MVKHYREYSSILKIDLSIKQDKEVINKSNTIE